MVLMVMICWVQYIAPPFPRVLLILEFYRGEKKQLSLKCMCMTQNVCKRQISGVRRCCLYTAPLQRREALRLFSVITIKIKWLQHCESKRPNFANYFGPHCPFHYLKLQMKNSPLSFYLNRCVFRTLSSLRNMQ